MKSVHTVILHYDDCAPGVANDIILLEANGPISWEYVTVEMEEHIHAAMEKVDDSFDRDDAVYEAMEAVCNLPICVEKGLDWRYLETCSTTIYID